MPNLSTPARLIAHPRRLIGICAVLSTLVGCLYLLLAGAPNHYPLINGLALLIGLGLVGLLSGPIDRASDRSWRMLLLGSAMIILLTRLFGSTVEGISRWIAVGPVLLQPALILLPLMLMRWARLQDRLSGVALLIVVVAIASQPDQSLSTALLLGSLLVASRVGGRSVWMVTVVAAGGLLASWLQDDPLPAVPFVESVYQDALSAGAFSFGLVLLGTILLLLPALIAWIRPGPETLPLGVFGVVWLTLVMAAVLGNYPTPLVGYGASSILGYTLCLLGLPRRSEA